MPFTGLLQIGRKSFQLLSFNISRRRTIDVTGKPGNNIQTVLKCCLNSSKEDNFFLHLFHDKLVATVNGEISFVVDDATKDVNVFTFKNAQCKLREENFTSTGTYSITIQLHIANGDFYNGKVDMGLLLNDIL